VSAASLLELPQLRDAGGQNRRPFVLDPRTVLLLLIVVNAIVMGNTTMGAALAAGVFVSALVVKFGLQLRFPHRLQVILCLQVEPELGRNPAVLPQTQRGIRRDRRWPCTISLIRRGGTPIDTASLL
jgi:hypothetical protein